MYSTYHIQIPPVLKWLLFTCILSHAGMNAFAQAINYAGKEFFLTLGGRPSGGTFHDDGSFIIVSRHAAAVNFRYTATGTTTTYQLTPYVPFRIDLTSTQLEVFANLQYEIVDNRSLHITADSSINVSFIVPDFGSTDALLLIPVDGQQQVDEYYLLGAVIMDVNGNFSYSLVASCDSTVLEITPVQRTVRHQAGVPFTVVLNEGETYQLATTDNFGRKDLSGTRIRVLSARKPISVFNTYQALGIVYPWASVSGGGCCSDIMLEQLMPVNLWDTVYYTMPFANMQSYMLRIMASEPNTTVYINNTPVAVLGRGAILDTVLSAAVKISASHPVGIGQFMMSQSMDPLAVAGDPDILWVYPLSQGIRETMFSPVDIGAPGYTVGWINIISPAANTGNILFNGGNITTFFNPVPGNPGMQYASIPVNIAAPYTLTSPEKILVYHYCVLNHSSYSLPLPDMDYDTTVLIAVAAKDTLYKCGGDTLTLRADPGYHYYWSTGDTTASLQVTDTGIYRVRQAPQHTCVAESYREFYIRSKPQDTLVINDTISFCGRPVTLTTGLAQAYTWSTGDTGRSVTVSDPGTYHVLETDAADCRQKLQIFHVLYQMDHASFYETVITCTLPVQLTARSADSYLWSTGDTGQTIGAGESGGYSVQETDSTSCVQNARFFQVRYADSLLLYLIADTVICEGDVITVHSGIDATQWPDGTFASHMLVQAPGQYIYTVYDTCGRVYRDSFSVTDTFCAERYCQLTFPTAFTPDGDGRNDIFRPVVYGQVHTYNLRIYNRWGTQIFISSDLKQGWDGRWQGAPAEVGSYFFYAEAYCPLRGEISIKGDVTLLR